MPMRSPYVIHLTKEHAELLARSREYTSPYRDVVQEDRTAGEWLWCKPSALPYSGPPIG